VKQNNHTRPPEQIQAEIEQTRHELDQTLNALQSRLTPGQLMDQGLDYLRHSGARQYVSNLGDTAKNDPVPLALVGIGLAWLMASGGRRSERATSGYDGDSTVHRMKERVSGSAQRISESAQRLSERATSARERAGQLGQSARERAGQLSQSARARASQLGESARHLGQSARHLGESARHRAGQMRDGYRHVVEEQPLAIGAVGLALGALLAASAPRTRAERRLAGEQGQRDEHRDREPDYAAQAAPERTIESAEPVTAYAPQPEPSLATGPTTLHH
jgi:hypothetical protein